MALIDAEEAGDLEAGIALFADDAVYTVLPLTPLDMPGPTIVGKDAIRAYGEAIAARNAEYTGEITGVESGGDGFPTYVVLMAIGGLTISVGLGLTLLHRRSF